jgi:creatinine amidohydrolase
MRLELMTSPTLAAYIAATPDIVVPIGSTEQHGPDGLIGTDHLCAEAVARRFGERAGVVVAPTLAYGMSQFHLGFAGTMTLRPSTLAAVVRDLVASLAVGGFRRIYFLNGHGGNLAPLRSGIQEHYAERSLAGSAEPAGAHCRVKSWWEFPGVNDLRATLYGAHEGYHATPSEIALTQAVFPEAIGSFERPAPEHGPDMILHAGDNYYDAADFVRRFPDGRVISHSALATPADGEAILEAAIAGLAEDFEAFRRSL